MSATEQTTDDAELEASLRDQLASMTHRERVAAAVFALVSDQHHTITCAQKQMVDGVTELLSTVGKANEYLSRQNTDTLQYALDWDIHGGFDDTGYGEALRTAVAEQLKYLNGPSASKHWGPVDQLRIAACRMILVWLNMQEDQQLS